MAKAGNWLEIEIVSDGYKGFADRLQLQPVEAFPAKKHLVQAPFAALLDRYIPMGGEIAAEDLGEQQLAELTAAGILAAAGERRGRSTLLARCHSLLNSPYLWGGKSCFGIDCSGLTQVVYKTCGYALQRDSGQQAQQGMAVRLHEASPGDLAFFTRPGKENISHVGVIERENGRLRVIHASGMVRIDELTEDGIITAAGECTHTLHSVRNIVDYT
jgi:cell wall-associated NlpC family hydrolase